MGRRVRVENSSPKLFENKKKAKMDKDTKQLMETNKFRVSLGMRPIERMNRECLKCKKTFVSDGAFNRLCYSCVVVNTNSEDGE